LRGRLAGGQSQVAAFLFADNHRHMLLELEAGFTPQISKGSSPLTLSNTVEFMIGAGRIYTDRGSKIAAEFALDFMFWPWPDRKLGWFLEPTYSHSFSKGHEQAAAVSVGSLIPIP
jgi:hypothetical protein